MGLVIWNIVLIGVILLVVALVTIAWLLYRRSKRRNSTTGAASDTDASRSTSRHE